MTRMSTMIVLALTVGMIEPAQGREPGVRNPDRASTVLEEVKLNLVAVAWNEAAANVGPDEIRAIWHTHWTIAGGRDASVEDILAAQRVLSSRVTEASTPREIGNERWSRHLRWNDDEPEGWRFTHLPWAPRFRDRYARARRFASRTVERHLGGRPVRQCRGVPRGWGGPGLDDHVFAARNEARVRRGQSPLVVLDCGDTHNAFFGLGPAT